MSNGTYRFGQIQFDVAVAATNTTPMGAYRGAGRPEAAALLERLVDQAAIELAIDPIELRKRNLITDDCSRSPRSPASPTTPVPTPPRSTWRPRPSATSARRAEQARRRARGDRVQLGIGVAVYVEVDRRRRRREFAGVEVHADGSATVRAGTLSHGQGHQTAFAMLVSERTGIPIERITLVDGDTDRVPQGGGTGGSRSLQLGGSAVDAATVTLVDQARELAAPMLEADVADVVLDRPPGRSAWPGCRRQHRRGPSWPSVRAGDDGALAAEEIFTQADSTFPFGAHIAVVEVDLDTGEVELVRHVAVDDCGTVLNPLLVEGQQHGGIAAGIGQALFEEVALRRRRQPAHRQPRRLRHSRRPPSCRRSTCRSTETPTPLNPLGAKGIGEAATIGSTPAVQNAVIDALAHLGVRHIDLPCTPERVWETIRDAEAGHPARPVAGAAADLRPPAGRAVDDGRRRVRPGRRRRHLTPMADDPATAAMKAKVLTVSDGVVHGTREDRSGAALVEQLTGAGYEVVDHVVTADGTTNVADTLVAMADGFAGLIVTTGGTGFAPRDQTPEGTRAAIEREAPGLAEAMRLVSPLGRLSRGIAGVRGRALICNTPARPRAASSNSARSSTCSPTPYGCCTTNRSAIDRRADDVVVASAVTTAVATAPRDHITESFGSGAGGGLANRSDHAAISLRSSPLRPCRDASRAGEAVSFGPWPPQAGSSLIVASAVDEGGSLRAGVGTDEQNARCGHGQAPHHRRGTRPILDRCRCRAAGGGRRRLVRSSNYPPAGGSPVVAASAGQAASHRRGAAVRSRLGDRRREHQPGFDHDRSRCVHRSARCPSTAAARRLPSPRQQLVARRLHRDHLAADNCLRARATRCPSTLKPTSRLPPGRRQPVPPVRHEGAELDGVERVDAWPSPSSTTGWPGQGTCTAPTTTRRSTTTTSKVRASRGLQRPAQGEVPRSRATHGDYSSRRHERIRRVVAQPQRPGLNFVVPNDCENGHDPCATTDPVSQFDAFVAGKCR